MWTTGQSILSRLGRFITAKILLDFGIGKYLRKKLCIAEEDTRYRERIFVLTSLNDIRLRIKTDYVHSGQAQGQIETFSWSGRVIWVAVEIIVVISSADTDRMGTQI